MNDIAWFGIIQTASYKGVEAILRYQEIKLELKKYIAEMSNGCKLPSRTSLAKKLDSSRATIDKAIRELEAEGILESRFGSGTYVARELDGVVRNVSNWCLIVPNISESIYAKLAKSIESEARNWNANVIICNSENDQEKQNEYIKRLIMAGVDGFIIVPVIIRSVMESVCLYQSLVQSKIPFVFCNRDVEGVSAPVIRSNDFYGGYLATSHLYRSGYKNIAFLSARRYRTSIERCQGYISAIQEKGEPIVRKRILMLEDGSAEECCTQLAELLKSDIPVDAVFCFNDNIAVAAMQTIEQMGLRVSSDIGVIGYDDNEIVTGTKVGLTSVSYRIEEVGELAARALKKKIESEDSGLFEYYLVEPRVVVRDSCLGMRGHDR